VSRARNAGSILALVALAGCGGGGDAADPKKQADELAACLSGKGLEVRRSNTAQNPVYEELAADAGKAGGVVVIGFDDSATPTVTFFVMGSDSDAKAAKPKLDELSPGASAKKNVLLGVLSFGSKTKPDREQQAAIDPCLDAI
jgi:hypothetical protein